MMMILWDWITGFFQNIPAAFWGVVAGSFFSLSGVILTNRASERRLNSQFLHERDLRNRDRELALRKDVYLSVSEAAYSGFIMLGKFSNLEVTQEKVTEAYLDRAPALAKVQIIAKEETAKAVVNVARELTGCILRLTVKRFPLDVIRQQLTVLDMEISAFGKERDRWVELMKLHNLEGSIRAVGG